MAYKWGFLTTYWDDPPSGCIAGSDFFSLSQRTTAFICTALGQAFEVFGKFWTFLVEANIVFEHPLKKTPI